MNKGLAVSISLLALMLSIPLLLRAQATGSVRLQVTDPSGAPMQAAGKLEGLATGVHRSFRTGARGTYTGTDLPFGRYRAEISKSGFATQSSLFDIKSQTTVVQTVTLPLASQAVRVDVVAATPLAGTDVPLDQIPAPVQTATARDVQKSGALDLSDFLNKRLNGVHVTENQENPFQPDVNYRGYTASPLLGTPEGISVYVDGVRQNQPFGDIVAWDLIPRVAIAEVSLVPGSNPLFGLNTLGGAVSIETKDGRSQPGTSIQVSGGSFGRRAGEFEHGGSNSKGLSWYFAGNLFREDGWRPYSPSEVRQAFGKVGWQNSTTSVGLAFSYADNWLTGNGLQEQRLIARDYSSVYTIPDTTRDHSPFLNVSARHSATNNLVFAGNAYFRYIRTDTLNANINSNSFDQSLYNLTSADVEALTAAGYSGFPITGNSTTEPAPKWRCLAQALQKDEPVEKCTGLLNNTFTKQNNYGFLGQASWFPRSHHVTAGSGLDRSSIAFRQFSQFGYLNSDYLTITPVNAFADGTTSQNGAPVDTRVNLHGSINTFSIFAGDTFRVGKSLSFTLSGRYNRTGVNNMDRLTEESDTGRGSLTGNYIFGRFNPAVGVTYKPSSLYSFYFSYSESSRAPTSIELGCADPNYPCNLPNALISDPPLKQVVTRTFEAGIRGSQEGSLRWSAGWFRAQNYNDLLFVASDQTGFGYFTNFGQTRREGAEASLSTRIRKITLGGNYTFLNATYQSPETVNGRSNSSNASALVGFRGLSDSISIKPGDRIPQIPQNILKAFADYQPIQKLTLDADFVTVGRSYARGNEDNLDRPDGVYYLGPGTSPGYGVLNFGARYQLQRRVQLFAQINNILDHHYYTGAQLGPTPFNNAGTFVGRPFPSVDGNYPLRTATFFAPGAPTGVWGGIRFHF